MAYVAIIRRNADGLVRRCPQEMDWDDGDVFWWTDGNFGCDCNRGIEFDCTDPGTEGTEPLPLKDWDEFKDSYPCGNEAYTVLGCEVGDRTVLIDGVRP